jgi:hypothetical protein
MIAETKWLFFRRLPWIRMVCPHSATSEGAVSPAQDAVQGRQVAIAKCLMGTGNLCKMRDCHSPATGGAGEF